MWFGSWLGTGYTGLWWGDSGGIPPTIGAWISGVSHYRNTSGVSLIAHTEAGDPISSVSKDKTDGITERWFIT